MIAGASVYVVGAMILFDVSAFSASRMSVRSRMSDSKFAVSRRKGVSPITESDDEDADRFSFRLWTAVAVLSGLILSVAGWLYVSFGFLWTVLAVASGALMGKTVAERFWKRETEGFEEKIKQHRAEYEKTHEIELTEKKLKKEREETIESVSEYIRILSECQRKISRSPSKIDDEILESLGELVDTLKSVKTGLEEDEVSVQKIRSVCGIYLSSVSSLIETFIDAAEGHKNTGDERLKASLAELKISINRANEELCRVLSETFKKKTLNMEVDASVLQSMMKMQGLVNDREFETN